MEDEFKLREIVFFRANGAIGFEEYEGMEARIEGPYKDYPVKLPSGKPSSHKGYAIKFSHNGRECIVRGPNITRLKPVRGDMDRVITWDYFHQKTGCDPRKEK